ncbi:neuronal acetylcholine receptor subunit non-alpha-2-like isoform X2 [Montipora foliosa]|uniref:neuronal acetylcholine receptor subunit non-alpha-2-like isoform X2 n=1 Tax=Montipora foliosa TaxID=591990 RepID=UPI0035F1D9C8
MARLLSILLFMVLLSAVVDGVVTNMTQVPEYQLRQDLFQTYDHMVRPVLEWSQVVNISFKLEFKALIEVDNKDQVITTETVVTQIWQNPFLRWNSSHYGGITHIFVEPKTIWVPDIVLENNADGLVVQAGHLEKFRTYVILRYDGLNTWVSPATFQSSCSLDVQYFPFDKQKCSMVFRSSTADRTLIKISTQTIKSDDPHKDLKLNTSNGYWALRSIEIKKVNSQKPQGEFSEVVVSFFIGRRPMFFVLFSIVPCMIIGMLTLVSFFIPAESVERIGLCATILLAVSVYLLVVTEQLPEQSETLPLIGVYYTVVMFEIGLALAATVLVLKAHHATSAPPKLLTYLTAINDISCRKRMVKRKNSNATSPYMVPGVEKAEPGKEEEDKENADVIESGEVETKKPRTSVTFSTNTFDESAMNQETWKEIAIALDRVFFWVFLTLFVLSSFAIYGQAGRLSSIDTF